MSDGVPARGCLVDLDKFYKIPSDNNLIPFFRTKLFKKNFFFFKIRKIKFTRKWKLKFKGEDS